MIRQRAEIVLTFFRQLGGSVMLAAALAERVDDVERLEHGAAQPAQLGHDEGVAVRVFRAAYHIWGSLGEESSWVKSPNGMQSQLGAQFVDAAFFGVSAGGDFDFDELVDEELVLLRILQEQVPLFLGILFVGADALVLGPCSQNSAIVVKFSPRRQHAVPRHLRWSG